MPEKKELKYYIKRNYGRDDMYLVECKEAKAIMKISGRVRFGKDYPISHDEMNGVEDLGFRFIQVVKPTK